MSNIDKYILGQKEINSICDGCGAIDKNPHKCFMCGEVITTNDCNEFGGTCEICNDIEL